MKKTAVAVVPEFANGATEAQVDDYNRIAKPSGYYGGAKFDLKKPMPRSQNRDVSIVPMPFTLMESGLWQSEYRLNGGAEQDLTYSGDPISIPLDTSSVEVYHETGQNAIVQYLDAGGSPVSGRNHFAPSGQWTQLSLPSNFQFSSIRVFVNEVSE